MQFRSEAHSLIFYVDPVIDGKGKGGTIVFKAHEYETEDKAEIDALSSDRAKASGVETVDAPAEPEAPVEPVTPPA